MVDADKDIIRLNLATFFILRLLPQGRVILYRIPHRLVCLDLCADGCVRLERVAYLRWHEKVGVELRIVVMDCCWITRI